MKSQLGWSLLLLAIAVAAGGGWALQRREAEALMVERDLLREQRRQVDVQRARQAELRALQPAPAELERLQADRMALDRLRAEVAATRAKIEQAESALRTPSSGP